MPPGAARPQPPAAPAAGRRAAGPASVMPPAAAARAGHRRAVAEFRARRAADQQARIDALLLEVIDTLASLLGARE